MFVHRSPEIEIQGKELQGVKVTVTHFLTGVLVFSGLVTKSAWRALPCAGTHARTHPPTPTNTIIKPIMQCSK